MKKLYSIEVKGNKKTWSFNFWSYSQYEDDWRKDGLKVVEILNVIPKWYVDMGFPISIWCFFEDIVNMKNPLREK